MNWADLWAALALLLILEGLMPFFSPRGYRNLVQQMAAMPESALRYTGLGMMLFGLFCLYLVRG
ncbi:MAG: DUF2065 domain-containing protein [Gammaproteobacteria bacterium]|nr:DUF2065 domain-containing protein [Gammaproteobacteria bacterium]